MHASITPLRQNLRPWVPSTGHKNRPQVLVVDDEPGIRRFEGPIAGAPRFTKRSTVSKVWSWPASSFRTPWCAT